MDESGIRDRVAGSTTGSVAVIDGLLAPRAGTWLTLDLTLVMRNVRHQSHGCAGA